MSEIPIDVLWTLQVRPPADSELALYVNQVPLFQSQALQDAFYDSGTPLLTFADPDVLAQVRALIEEVRAHVPPPSPVEGFLLTGRLSGITHYPRGQWLDAKKDIGSIRWTQEVALGGKPFGSGTDSATLPLATLSAISKAAIQRLDVLATETAYRRHYDRLRIVQTQVSQPLPPPTKVRAFIAYRRSQFDRAKAWYGRMLSYAEGTLYAPYLDHHDIRSGDWLAQLKRAIDTSHVFVPLLSEDFAAPDSVSAEELAYALSRHDSPSTALIIAPVLLSQHLSEAAAQVTRFDGCPLVGVTTAQEALAVDEFLKRVATTVLAHIARTAT